MRSNFVPDGQTLEQPVNLQYLGHDVGYENDGRPTYITYITYVTYITNSILLKCAKRISRDKVNKRGISGFRLETDESCDLLGHYAASSGHFLPTFRDNL